MYFVPQRRLPIPLQPKHNGVQDDYDHYKLLESVMTDKLIDVLLLPFARIGQLKAHRFFALLDPIKAIFRFLQFYLLLL